MNSLNETYTEMASKYTPRKALDDAGEEIKKQESMNGLVWDDNPPCQAPPSSTALTYDEGKPPLAYLPWDAIREMAHVQLYGQQKYGSFWNYKKGMELGRNLSCAIRHIAAFMDGEDLDKESQCSHLGHAMCRVAFALQNLNDGTAIDDRHTQKS